MYLRELLLTDQKKSKLKGWCRHKGCTREVVQFVYNSANQTDYIQLLRNFISNKSPKQNKKPISLVINQFRKKKNRKKKKRRTFILYKPKKTTKTTYSSIKQVRRSKLRIWQAIPIGIRLVIPSRRFLKPHPSFWQNNSLQCRARFMPLLSNRAFVYIWCFIGWGCHESDILNEADKKVNADTERGTERKFLIKTYF